jgi:hypothetical protein
MLIRLRAVALVCDVPIEAIECGRGRNSGRSGERCTDKAGDNDSEFAVPGRVASEEGEERS